MSRGGRGGGGVGRMNGKDLPFEIDTALEDQITAYTDGLNDDDEKTLYPEMKIHHAPPATAREKKMVNKWREIREARRNGPFFIDAPQTGKRDPADFNAFEDVDSYSSKRVKRAGGLHSLKHVGIVKELLPEELWSVVDDGEEAAEGTVAPKKNLAFLKKRRLDKLARFDDGAEVDLTADADDDDDKNGDDEGADAPEELEDDDFTEDDDDLGDDYNAEKYFSGGENNEDDGGGDDGGGEDPCAADVLARAFASNYADRKIADRKYYNTYGTLFFATGPGPRERAHQQMQTINTLLKEKAERKELAARREVRRADSVIDGSDCADEEQQDDASDSGMPEAKDSGGANNDEPSTSANEVDMLGAEELDDFNNSDAPSHDDQPCHAGANHNSLPPAFPPNEGYPGLGPRF